jgi:hypothetical protein
MNICSFVHQCNIFTFYFLLFVDMFRPHTAIFRCYSILSRSWCSVMPIFAYVMVPAMCFCWWCAYCQCPSVNYIMLCFVMLIIYQIAIFICFYLWYTITLEDGCVRPKHRRIIENKKWMCYIDGQKNKYSV